jgi:hypothetical protein
VYGQGISLDTSNKLVVEMDFTKAGSYVVTTDTINGMYFADTGNVSATGLTFIALKGRGQPLNPGTFSYKVSFKGSVCTVLVDVYQVAPAGSGDYFPTTGGNNWTYISSDPAAAPTDTALQVSTGLTGTILGNTYSLFVTKVDTDLDSSYYRKGGGEYRQFGDIDVSGIASNFVLGDYIFLKDTASVGSTWESPTLVAIISSQNVNMRLQFTILERNVNVLIGNRVFQNVIKVRTIQQIQAGTTWQNVVSYESWYARGIGLINVAVAAPVYGYQVLKYTVF